MTFDEMKAQDTTYFNQGLRIKSLDVRGGRFMVLWQNNTGRTSGPHLHFQAQADSKDWGPSVPITFNNCDVPTTDTTVTSTNSNPKFP
jgi:hypothetical protein